MSNEIKIFCSKDWPSSSAGRQDYELLDTGEGEKLERFGSYTFVRPCENAVWSKCSTPSVQQLWAKADGKFWSSKVGAKAGWKMQNKTEDRWEMQYKGIKFLASPTPFRHLGFFPEQASHWDFIENTIAKQNYSPLEEYPLGGGGNASTPSRKRATPQEGNIKFLNLFGYTGVASLFALRAGAEVTHLDASKQILKWAKENQEINDELAQAPMRIIEDDAIKFLEREAKRGNKYDAIIMDPPKFGRGPKGEVWKIEEMLPKLLASVKKVLSDKPLFVILTSYAIDSSSLSLGYALEETMKDFSGSVETGELCVLEKSNNRIIPLANTAVWSV
ncbi:MAG: class I SAM-dependent methyltransferase [bacterium]